MKWLKDLLFTNVELSYYIMLYIISNQNSTNMKELTEAEILKNVNHRPVAV